MLALPAEFEQFHWMVDMVQNVDMGLIVINRDYNVQVWNGFMTHHSGKQAHDVIGKSLFEIFPEIPVEWFKLKTKPVYDLGCRSFITWQQRPYLFLCRNVRPVTQQAKFMYQNVTLNPMRTPTGAINSLFLSIQDATSEALVSQQASSQ
ncbi:diguanylate cyclase [Vibrio cholerae]|uniref:Diguanylate cyclase n=1 Tax=Vibrio cholerae TaxID=666 RepID=A0A395U8M7_VIBCL|nr:PAS domain-containing protein [Vibrio cholerae]RGP82024.1 diguanylate cyclase [Vibrio cholerae]RGP89477.1 diguanylate cyclase [Vibrio cholerae]RGP89597.1 diguanylate cyclase [Vibrio cholerae]RGP92806.1 diguanylate cyclase [Vibrio cholerae]TLE12115.1 PAS domain-containing protein [Vibrio cholerae]